MFGAIFLIKIWFNSFNYFLSTNPEIQTLSWLGKMKSHMGLLNPRKTSFGLPNGAVFLSSVSLNKNIFSQRHRVYTEWQKHWPVKCALCLTWGDLRKGRKNSSVLNEVKCYFGVYRSRPLFKLTVCVHKSSSEILLSPSLDKNIFWHHKMEFCPRWAQVGLYSLGIYSLAARQTSWFYFCIRTLPVNISLE